MSIKVGINGFGRIGRQVFTAAQANPEIEILAVNDITSPEMLAHLLKYDSVHGRFPGSVGVESGSLVVNGRKVQVLAERDPAQLPWGELDVDYVVESTGLFTAREAASQHLTAGARRVVISAPAKNEDITIVLGVNEGSYDPNAHKIVSNASCTTNCLAPVAKVIMDTVGIVSGVMTTIHSYTNDQRILDLPHKDYRRARAAAINMIPTTTGAAKAVSLVLPELSGKLDGMAIRVPTPNVSVVDLVVKTEKTATVEGINNAMKEAAEGPMKGILDYVSEPLVSGDFNHDPHSSNFDAGSTMVVGGDLLKVLSWYDNEWGYSNRVVDLVAYMAGRE